MKHHLYALPLHTGEIRKGLLLQTAIGVGEVAPLPGRSKETLDEVLVALEKKQVTLPSLLFGVESALTPLPALSAPLAAFLSGSPSAILERAESAKAAGYTHAKLKISHLQPQEAKPLIQTLKEQFRLRVDCNRIFSLNEALDFFSSFAEDAFDFIEEPTHEISHLSAFSHPFALDETLLECSEIPDYPKLTALILKPTILGGESGCAPWVKRARAKNLRTVFGSAFESGVGILHIARLAEVFQSKEPLGLDTYRLFKQDLLARPLDFSSPILTFTPPLILHDPLPFYPAQ
ncbi:MAG: hypothetical protein JSS61_03050 [Verrucomicrobia bacterium]|nr:hypothetical protein [Verrucomicrobiota bacterium]